MFNAEGKGTQFFPYYLSQYDFFYHNNTKKTSNLSI